MTVASLSTPTELRPGGPSHGGPPDLSFMSRACDMGKAAEQQFASTARRQLSCEKSNPYAVEIVQYP